MKTKPRPPPPKKNQDISKLFNSIPGQSLRIFVVTQKYNIQQKKYQAWKETEKCGAHWEKNQLIKTDLKLTQILVNKNIQN